MVEGWVRSFGVLDIKRGQCGSKCKNMCLYMYVVLEGELIKCLHFTNESN